MLDPLFSNEGKNEPGEEQFEYKIFFDKIFY